MDIIYLRTSTEEQNPQNQLKDCLTLVKGEYEVIEERQSAWKDKDRDLFDSIKKRIQKREVSNFVVWDLDRIYRKRNKLIEFFEFCKIYKTRIHSFRQSWLEELNKIPEPFNEIMHSLMLSIMGWLAEEESQKRSDRIKIAYQNRNKKWGRKSFKEKTILEIIDLKKDNPKLSVRELSERIFVWDKNNNKKNVSKSFVHKILNENKARLS